MIENQIKFNILLLMAISSGLCVAGIYYAQPLLYQLQNEFNVSSSQIGLIPTLTQIGYALGMLFIIPLGDRYEKKKLTILFTILNSLSLILFAFSNSFSMLLAISPLIGILSMTPQFMIPFCVEISPKETRGKNLGFVMAGLLLGILLARTYSGFIGDIFGWRFAYLLASAVVLVLSILQYFLLPTSQPNFHGNYFKLITSIFTLIKSYKKLRQAMMIGALHFGAFSAFWATLIFLMESPQFHYGPKAVGLFGIIGAAGALTAPLIGRLADKRDPIITVRLGAILMVTSYIMYYFLGGSSILALIFGVILMDVGLQATHVSNQNRVFGLDSNSRNRLNTAYMFSYFLGGASGSFLGTVAWQYYQWPGVSILGIAITILAFLLSYKKVD